MENTKCYCVSFNVGNNEVWTSNLFTNKVSALLETEESKDEIIERTQENILMFSEDNEAFKILENALLQLKQYGKYKDKKNILDFFIIEQTIFSHYNQN